jgi:hypothetical protein
MLPIRTPVKAARSVRAGPQPGGRRAATALLAAIMRADPAFTGVRQNNWKTQRLQTYTSAA